MYDAQEVLLLSVGRRPRFGPQLIERNDRQFDESIAHSRTVPIGATNASSIIQLSSPLRCPHLAKNTLRHGCAMADAALPTRLVLCVDSKPTKTGNNPTNIQRISLESSRAGVWTA